METVLVTGATGQLGKAVVEALVEKKFSVRAAARNAGRIATTRLVEPVEFEYENYATYDHVLDRSLGVFLVAPPLDPDAPVKLIPFIDAARKADVVYIVLCSALGADANEQSPLRVIERYLTGSDIGYTIIRPNFFMENFSTGFLAPMIAGGEIALAAGDGRTSFVSIRDVAEAVAALFVEACCGTEYDLTGPEALSYSQVAKMISDVSKRKIAYRDISDQEMILTARGWGLPENAARCLAELYGAVRSDSLSVVTKDMQKLIGRSPISFSDFAGKNASRWRLAKAA